MSKEMAKRVIKKILDNTGKAVSVSKAMREVGFKPGYYKNPQDFTSTKVFQELVKQYLPDEMITQRHNELANASEIEHYVFPNLSKTKKKKKGETKNELTNDEIRMIVESVPGCQLIYVKRDIYNTYAFFTKPDSRSRKDAIDMAYKIKGSYAPEQIDLGKRKYQHLSNAELMALQTKLKNFLLKK